MSYFVKEKEQYGRCIVASKDLKAAEEILTEEPVSLGPKSYTYLLCLGCYMPQEDLLLCSVCSWPICSPECSQNPWHSENECKIFSQAGVKYSNEGEPQTQLECITPLRTLLVKEKNKEKWEKEVISLESHWEERKKNTERAEEEQVNVVQFLRGPCKLEMRFREEEIEKVCGILEVNCYEALTREGGTLRALYPLSSLLNHCCVANTTHSIIVEDNFRLQLRSTVDLPSGQELFSSYTSCFNSTIVRRAKLRLTKYFDCVCPRCSDPTELGSHIGTLKCTKCDNGIITSSQPTDDSAPWACSHCGNRITGVGVQKIYQAIEEDLEAVEAMENGSEKLEATEKLLRKFKSVLHPRNGANVSLWHSLCLLYGHVEGYTMDMLPDLLLERKAKFCEDLIQTLDIIEPGKTRMRGMVLFEYHVALVVLCRSRYQTGELTLEAMRREVARVCDLLEQVRELLSGEPVKSLEAQLAVVAQHSKESLLQSLDQLHPE